MARARLKLSPSKTPSAFSEGLGGVLGGLAGLAMVGLVCFILFAIGYMLIVKNNKPGTKLFEQIQPLQYLGIFICFIAIIPFLSYFFMGFLFDAGGAAFESLME
jgi:hypothetical protein